MLVIDHKVEVVTTQLADTVILHIWLHHIAGEAAIVAIEEAVTKLLVYNLLLAAPRNVRVRVRAVTCV